MEASEIHITPRQNQKPISDLPHTRSALICLQSSLQCRKCCQCCKELFTLGQCEHRFCRSCAEETLGEICPMCDMPSHVTQAHVDKQLSNIALLCMQMSDLLEGRPSALVWSKDSEKKTPRSSRKKIVKEGEKDPSGADSHCTKRNGEKNATSLDEKQHALSSEKECDIDKSCERRSSTSSRKRKENLFTREEDDTTHKRGSISKRKKEKSVSLPLQAEKPEVKTSPGPRRQGRKSEPLTLQNADRGDTTSLKCKLSSSLLTPKLSSARERKGKRDDKSSSSKDKTKSKSYLAKRNAKGETPLQVATIKADGDTVRKLLEAGANPNVRDNAGWTPLHEAVNHGNGTIAELLINHGASVNAPGLDNDTPLHDAVSNYRLDCVRLLVSRGADTLARNVHGRIPLDLAQTDEMREMLLTASGTSTTTTDEPAMINEDDDSQPLCFLGTALSRDQQAMLHKCAKMLHAKTADEFSHEVTHLVTGVNAEGMCPRTLKYLNVILAGKWVLSAEWLSACLEYSQRVPEEGFEIAGCSTNPGTMAPHKARQNRLQQLPGLFDGCQVYFHGKFNYPTPSREELAGLVKQGGGVLLTREPRLHSLDDYPYTIPFHASQSSSLADCAIFVIYDDSCPNPPQVDAQRMSCLPVSWLMDSIATFSLLDKSLYLKQ